MYYVEGTFIEDEKWENKPVQYVLKLIQFCLL